MRKEKSEDILYMNAGMELDVMVHEEVMGMSRNNPLGVPLYTRFAGMDSKVLKFVRENWSKHAKYALWQSLDATWYDRLDVKEDLDNYPPLMYEPGDYSRHALWVVRESKKNGVEVMKDVRQREEDKG